MKKSRIIALIMAVMMVMSAVPAFAAGYFVDEDGAVYEKNGENLISNPGFEEGLIGLTTNSEYYEVSQEAAHEGEYSLKAIKSTKGDGAISAYFAVGAPSDSYYLSFWYKNTDDVARRPRVTFAFTDADKVITDDESTNAWISAGTASNDQDMEYSTGEWVQYSTVINGNGNANDCAYVYLNIYGLTKDVSYIDSFELYDLAPSDEYGATMAEAVANWESYTIPRGPLAGVGTIELPRETGVEGILVEWSSSSETINAETGEYQSGTEEELVILTATLYAEGKRDEVYHSYEYPYIVKSMFVPYVEWLNSEVFPEIGNAIDSDLTLPYEHAIEGYPAAEFTWSCSVDGVLDENGKYTAPETTCYVDLVVTISCAGASEIVTKRVKAIGGHIVPDGLIMYYDFEKSLGSKSTLFDVSNSDNIYNATVEGVTLMDGYASFQGSGSTIKLPSNYATELTGSYSVSMWVKVHKSIATSGAMYRFFDFGGGTYTSQFLRYIPASGQLTFMDRGTAADGGDWAIDTTATGFGDTWKLVSFTFDKSNSAALAKVYVDGVEVATSGNYSKLTNSVFQVATQSSTTGFIGRTQWNNGENPDFMGLMDDVRIYNRVLTAEDVTTLYENTRPTVVAPVTIKFQDVDGETLQDDVTVSVDVDTTYDVPASYKSLPSSSDDQYRYVYKYISSKSIDSISVSADSENVCILVFELEKQPKGTNLIENGSFENGTTGWTNRQGTAITEATVEYDNSIGANVMKIATGGKSGTNNIGTVWNVEVGKEYTISFDIYATAAVSESNYQFNRLTDGFKLGDVGQRENSGNGIIEWGEGLAAGSWTHFKKTFTAATDTLYFQSSWTEEMKYTNFVLEEVTGSTGDEEEDDSEKHSITIKYQDRDGNKIKDDVVATAPITINEYVVPDSYKVVENSYFGTYMYMYTYNDELSKDTISPSILRENVCTLVFDTLMVDSAKNLVADGDFMGDDGKFSWGTWQSPETGNYFKDTCQDWFYQVNRDTNASALYLAGLAADDYALGTRWNDGTNGLCSMANFIPVKSGKTYVVSYDYKHKNPSAAQKDYISTSFQRSQSLSAGSQGMNVPATVTTDWQTNTFTITAAADGYIYFHFSYLGESSNGGNGPFWYFDNFAVYEVQTNFMEAVMNKTAEKTIITVTNQGEGDEVVSCKVFVASFEGDVMTKVESKLVEVGAGESKPYEFTVTGDDVRAFFWNEMDPAYKILQ